MQKNPTAGGGGLKGSKKGAKITKKVRTIFADTPISANRAH